LLEITLLTSVILFIGLRTLCLGYAQLSKEEYDTWALEHQDASTTLENREAKLDAVAEKIEKNLILIGATAIEDKLQEGVPESIAELSSAGIKIWVLTGDKMETAINIGFSCNLLTRDMHLIVIKAVRGGEEGLQDIKNQLKSALVHFFDKTDEKGNPLPPRPLSPSTTSAEFPDSLQSPQTAEHLHPHDPNQPVPRHALIIDGASLQHSLTIEAREDLVKLATSCAAVICCRVSPLQKAQVVELVKAAKNSMCLAIGDGANDVSMIQAAHVGVGIAGEEGLQAVMAADYAIAQFRYLSRLLLVHGHWSYFRTAEMVLNFFVKNLIFV